MAITAYKAFESDMTCRGFQYEVGQTYHHEGPVKECESGFHACENPFDVLLYYDLIDSKFARVTMDGETDVGSNKIASATITIDAELAMPDFIASCIKWVMEKAKGGENSSGGYAKLAASGYNAKLAASGDNAQLAASGDNAKLAASGGYAQLAASGYNAQLAASGYNAQLAASGYNAKLAASGYNAKLAASGDNAKLAASGDNAKLAASGYNAQLAASGGYAQLAASGGYAQLAASGYNAKLAASGGYGVIAASSPACRAKGAKGTWISLAEFADGKCVGFATGCIGSDGLKPDTWYIARGGKLVEAD